MNTQPLKPGEYMLTNFRGSPCHIDTPGMFCRSNHSKSHVDIESDLFLRKGSKSAEVPHLKGNEELQNYTEPPRNENPFLLGETTKMSRSCNTLSGVHIDRFHTLPTSLQEKVDSNNKIGVNSRLQAKDCIREPAYGSNCRK